MQRYIRNKDNPHENEHLQQRRGGLLEFIPGMGLFST